MGNKENGEILLLLATTSVDLLYIYGSYAVRNLVGDKMKLGRLTKQEQQRHKARLNLIAVENEPARDATSFTDKVRPSTGEVVACKWTKRCIMDNVVHNGNEE